MSDSATEADYRTALYEAQRGLMYAAKWVHGDEGSAADQAKGVIEDALAEVNRVLDIGRDESREQIAT